jgi:hypothetical protein
MRLPTEATALLRPEATPVRFAGTVLRTVAVSGATVRAIPNPSKVIDSAVVQ